MRYVADSLLSSLYGVNHVVNPFKLQKHSPPSIYMLHFVTNSQSVFLSSLNKA